MHKLKTNYGHNAELFEEIAALSTPELLEALRSRKYYAEDVTRTYIVLAKRAHERTNCLVDTCFDEAISQAKALDRAFEETGEPVGRLHGLPVSIKECLDMTGRSSSLGVGKLTTIPAVDDAVIVQRLVMEGAVPFCRTNVPQTLLTMECGNPVFGVTTNPHDPLRTPGGSSGGESALLAAGGSPLGIGTDIAGSCRIPAAWAGCCGFKPTVSILSKIGGNSFNPQEFIKATAGPMAMDVESLIQCMEAITTTTSQQPTQVALDPSVVQLSSFRIDSGQKPKLRIGYFEELSWFSPSPACRRAVRETVKRLEMEGHELVPFTVPRLDELMEFFFNAVGADGGVFTREFLDGEDVEEHVKGLAYNGLVPPFVKSVIAFVSEHAFGETKFAKVLRCSNAKDVATYNRLFAERKRFKNYLMLTWRESNLDALISPPVPCPAITHNTGKLISPLFVYTFLWNVVDFPAGVVPVTKVTQDDVDQIKGGGDMYQRIVAESDRQSEGLPVGVQVCTLPWTDALCLHVMKEIEKTVSP